MVGSGTTSKLTMLFGPLIGVETIPALLSPEPLESVKEEVSILESSGFKEEDVPGDFNVIDRG